MLAWIILFSVLGSVGVVLFTAMFVLLGKKRQGNLVYYLVSFATGVMLSTALLELLPEAAAEIPLESVLLSLLCGIIFFFLIEKLVLWRHCHEQHCEAHKAKGSMIIIGDSFHNFLDGIIIAASFLSSFMAGVIVSVALILHEISQEVGDFAVLLHSGYSKKKAIIFNLFAGLTTLPAAVIAYFALGAIESAIPYAMCVSAAGFIYIALADLYPSLHTKYGLKHTVQQMLFMLVGVAAVVFVLQLHH